MDLEIKMVDNVGLEKIIKKIFISDPNIEAEQIL